MPQFEDLLKEATAQDPPEVFAGIAVTVDKSGKTLQKIASGHRSLNSDNPVPFDAALSCFSVTKLLTTVAALQCVERGQIGLDEDLSAHLPELAKQPVITLFDDGNLVSLPTTQKITLRRLLTHTSGLPYDGISPAVIKWRKDTQDLPSQWACGNIMRAYNHPLIFQPGESFHYGGSIDWAGLLVCRLNGVEKLGQYMEKNIWDPLGMKDTTFELPSKPGLKERLLQMVSRNKDGQWVPAPGHLLYPEQPDDHCGGLGIISTVPDLSKVLSDLLSDTPKLLSLETIDQMFTPQFDADGPLGEGLEKNSFLYLDKIGEAPRKDGKMNVSFGLGGAVTVGQTANLPVNTLLWGGKTHIAWFINRDIGVAGVYAGQVLPGGDQKTNQMIGAFIRSAIAKAKEAKS